MINNQYPLYRRRGGDLFYMLETGLLEQLKPSPDEDTGVATYFDQFVDALYHATKDASAPRAPRSRA